MASELLVPPAARPSFLANQALKLLIFGGKGGVGKTTTAAATALFLAREELGDVLLISTDPAHSLGDSLQQPIGDQVTAINRVPNLYAVELDALHRLEVFKARYGDILRTIADRGTYFDDEDIHQFLDLSLPGMDELMAIIEVMTIVRDGRYGQVVLDTAPTGHTLRMLELPKLMEQWLHLFDLMLRKHRYMASLFGRYKPDDTDRFLAQMSSDLERLRGLLNNNRLCEFVPVTIPEAMSIEETTRLVQSLARLSIQVNTIIINRVVPETSDCSFCSARHRMQQRHLSVIVERFGHQRLLTVPLMTEVRGIEALGIVARILAGEGSAPSPQTPEHVSYAPKPNIPQRAPAPRSWREHELILVGGKGGVGKTTIATALAMQLARSDPDERVLLFSCDPAHSLSDCLDQVIGDRITAVRGVEGLDAFEVDPKDVLDELTQTYVAEIDEVFNSFLGTALDVSFDRQVMEELMVLIPPGLDELMALIKVMDVMREQSHTRYVLDLAPTGHALRLLETPALVRRWFNVFFQLLIKYRGVVQLNKVADLLYTKSKELRRLHKLLTDAERSQFIPVTIPEAMSVAETRRLLEQLRRLSMMCHQIVVNMVQPLNTCRVCGAIYQEQQGHLAQIRELGLEMIEVPLRVDEPRGADRLLDLGEMLHGEI